MNLFGINFGRLWRDVLIVSWALFKVMIPTLIIVKFAQEAGMVDLLDTVLMPVTKLIGLPKELSIVLTTTILTNPYAGLIILASTDIPGGLTVAQSTILACFMLFAHALPIEAAISRQAGAKATFIIVLRLGAAILYCLFLHLFFSYFGLFETRALITLPEFKETPTVTAWVINQIKGLVFIQVVIIVLLTALEILKKLQIERLLGYLMSPLLKLIGIGGSASTIVVVGLTLGLGFGGGLMIKDVKAGNVPKMDAVAALVFINLFHSVIEDTPLVMLLGPGLFYILIGRLIFALILSYIVISFLRMLSPALSQKIAVNMNCFK
ncbi:MAG: nucleoside recognition domain-containing protein, partial [Marinovum sp.]|nr:nucleoside recognition domain-containing protein [Marinovum sp.]